MRWNLSVAALAASWGLIGVVVKHVQLGATALVFYRVALAAAAIAAGCALARRLDLLRVPAARARLALVGAGLAAHWFLFFETIKLSSVAVALVLVYTAPLFLALLAPLALPERFSAVALAALVPGGAGLALVAFVGEGGGSARPLAVAVGLGAALTYALLVIGTKQLTLSLHPLAIAFWNYTTASLVLAPFLATGRVVPRAGEAGYLLLLGVVFTAASGFVYISLLRRVTAQAVGILAFLEPVSAALLAWLLLGESLSAGVVAGGVLVLAAGALVVLYEPSEGAAVEAAGVGSTPE